jgi:hypothetical protein
MSSFTHCCHVFFSPPLFRTPTTTKSPHLHPIVHGLRDQYVGDKCARNQCVGDPFTCVDFSASCLRRRAGCNLHPLEWGVDNMAEDVDNLSTLKILLFGSDQFREGTVTLRKEF